LRELGKIERTLFLLQYISSVELRRRIHVGLNKGEAKNALARAVFFNRLGELRDRTHENQRHRASGLNLVVGCWGSMERKTGLRPPEFCSISPGWILPSISKVALCSGGEN
jgi:hypothetical protein